MNTRILVLTGAIALAMAPTSQAATHKGGEHHRPHSFTQDVTRTNAKGQTVSRHTEQTVSATGLQRKTVVTNGKGDTASRNVDVVIDKAAGTATKTVQKTDFNGATSERTVTRTLKHGV